MSNIDLQRIVSSLYGHKEQKRKAVDSILSNNKYHTDIAIAAFRVAASYHLHHGDEEDRQIFFSLSQILNMSPDRNDPTVG